MKDSVRHPTPQSPELGTHDGLAYALFLPEDEPDPDRARELGTRLQTLQRELAEIKAAMS